MTNGKFMFQLIVLKIYFHQWKILLVSFLHKLKKQKMILQPQEEIHSSICNILIHDKSIHPLMYHLIEHAHSSAPTNSNPIENAEHD